jgi:hypothetical protein
MNGECLERVLSVLDALADIPWAGIAAKARLDVANGCDPGYVLDEALNAMQKRWTDAIEPMDAIRVTFWTKR